jgi:hypothetical protein
MTTTLKTASGRTFTLPPGLDPARVAGLDEEWRIVVDDFDARNSEPETVTFAGGAQHTLHPFMFGLTLCCNASDKGAEGGTVCRGCYGRRDVGNYIYRAADGSFPGLDPVVPAA